MLKRLCRILLRRGGIFDAGERARAIGVRVGKDCEIYDDVNFGSEPYLIELGDHVRVTRGCKFITHDGAVWVLRQKYGVNELDLFRPIKVGNNVHIGMNSIINPGVIIGDNVIVGSGSIVTKTIPSGEIWGGVPAKKISTIEEYYLKHKKDFDFTKSMDESQKREYLLKKYGLE